MRRVVEGYAEQAQREHVGCAGQIVIEDEVRGRVVEVQLDNTW
jgi:hypothetical protein